MAKELGVRARQTAAIPRLRSVRCVCRLWLLLCRSVWRSIAPNSRPAVTSASGGATSAVVLVAVPAVAHKTLLFHWLLVAAIITAAVVAASLIMPRNVHVFRAAWILHPDETGYLMTSRHLAEHGSLVIRDSFFAEDPSHVPPGTTAIGDQIVPRKAVGGYFVYAAAFLVSDTAWLWVGPLFGVLAALAAAAIVKLKTGNMLAAAGCAVLCLTASPMIVYASGLAVENVIATAMILCGVLGLALFARRPRVMSGMLSGLGFGFGMAVRYDMAVAAVLAGIAVVVLVATAKGRRRSVLLASLPGGAIFLACGIGLMCSNRYFYGSVFSTGYAGGWQESPSGVGGSFLTISIAGFRDLFSAYMLQIGFASTLLLVAGVAVKCLFGVFDASDFVLISFAGFCIVYFLGHPGAGGTGGAALAGSYPRYMLPVYLIGPILGTEAIALLLPRMRLTPALSFAALTLVAILGATAGIREAFTNKTGVPYIERLTKQHEVVRDVVYQTAAPVVVVSDLNSKAVLDAYTITPNKSERSGYDLVSDVRAQLQDGKHVVAIGDLRSHRLYTGYIEALRSSDLVLVPRRCAVEVYEVFLPQDAPRSIASCRN